MYEVLVKGKTLPEAYHKAIVKLYKHGEKSTCTDYNTTQKEISLTMQVLTPLMEPMITKCFFGGPDSLEQYRQEMLDGILDFEVERGNWEYTYHKRMEAQIPFIIEELRRTADSRRAVIDTRAPEDLKSGSPACLQNLHFLIRKGALHLIVLFRSNDAVKAAFMNAFALILLQKRIADELGVKMGTYTHRANSFHVYEKDDKMFTRYYERITDGEDLSIYYKGDWEFLMEEAKPAIAQKVAIQQAKTQ